MECHSRILVHLLPFYVFVLIFLIVSSVWSQDQGFKGVVIDAERKTPLKGANIIVEGTNYGTASDQQGRFKLLGFAPGTYRVVASMMGYQKRSKSITIKANTVVEVIFELHPTVLRLQGVAVTGERWRNVIVQPKLESRGLELSTSIITETEMQKIGAKVVTDAVKYIPGGLIETRGRKVKQFVSFRGQTYPYPDYAIDGTWQREFHETPYFFSTADIERIEIIRSSAALLTGLSGMAGVINIIPKEYEKTETSGEFEYGTFNTYRAHLSHGGRTNKVSYATGLGIRSTDGPEGMNAAEKIADFYGSANWQPNKAISFKTSVFHLNGWRELARAVPPASLKYQNLLQKFDPIRTTLVNMKLHIQSNDRASTEIRLSYADRDNQFENKNSKTLEVTRQKEADHELTLNIIQALTLSDKNVLRVGALYNHWVAPNGKRFYLGKECDVETYSAVIVDEHRFGQLNVDAGVRWEKTHYNKYGGFGIEGSGKAFKKVTPITDEWQPGTINASLGAAYYFPQIFSLHLNLATGVVKPRPGSLDTALVEPKDETRTKVDAGVRGVWENFGAFSVVGFYTRQKNGIAYSGLSHSIDGRVMELYINRDQDQYGIEFEVKSVRLFNLFETFTNVTAMKARAEAAGSMIEDNRIPKFIWNAGLFAQRGHFDLNFLCKYVSAYENVRFAAQIQGKPAKPQPLGDFVNIDLTVGWSFGSMHQSRLYLEIKNLADEAYSTVVGYPDFGRRVRLGFLRRF